MDDADPPLLSQGDGHLALGDGVHRRAEQGDIQADSLGKLGGDVAVGRHDLAIARFQQHVVEGQSRILAYFMVHGVRSFWGREGINPVLLSISREMQVGPACRAGPRAWQFFLAMAIW